MKKVFGPDTQFARTSFEDDEIPFETDAATLSEALDAYARRYDVTFAPYDGSYPELPLDPAEPKYFVYRSKRPKWEDVLVDIHIERDGQVICPRQSIAIPLLPNDVIKIGPLVC